MPKKKITTDKATEDLVRKYVLKTLAEQADKNEFAVSPEKSVVKIFTTAVEHSYEHPWQSEAMDCTGSGFVIDGNKLITNAHVVSGHRFVQVRLSGSAEKYTARVHTIGNGCDLAMLEVDDPKFWAQTEPVKMGEMVSSKNQDAVTVIGFPMGGEEVSFSKGVVSRVEVDTYAQSGQELLQVQVDAAINPGNSGGPVFNEQGQLVGVAFQGYARGQNLGYMIPIPIVQHFLKDVAKGEYQGFPHIAFSYQTLENNALREELGLEDEQTGVRVKSVSELSSAHGILKANDIILKIDGTTVQNDGYVETEFDTHIDMFYLINRKFVGDSLNLTVLRDGKEKKLTVPLKYTEGYTSCIKPYVFEDKPTYYIAEGVVFQPVSENYMQSAQGEELEETHGDIYDRKKKNPDDELIVISHILRHNGSTGYKYYKNELVKKVNDVEVHNMQELVDAIESSDSDVLKIETELKHLIVIKRLEAGKHFGLLRDYGIPDICSDDVRTFQTPRASVPQAANGEFKDDFDEDIELGDEDTDDEDAEDDVGYDSAEVRAMGKRLAQQMFTHTFSDSDSEDDEDYSPTEDTQRRAGTLHGYHLRRHASVKRQEPEAADSYTAERKKMRL